MKSIYFKPFVMAALLLPSFSILAEGGQPIGPQQGYTTMTLTEAKSAADDSLVSVRGYIVKRLSDDEYLLQKNTDSLIVEIDDHLWHGIQITDQHEVQLQGEIDQDWDRTELEVRWLKVLTQ